MNGIVSTPSPAELFSGRPVEWSPFDTDARALRWSTLTFRVVSKGEDAAPKLPSPCEVAPTEVDKEKLRRLVLSFPTLPILWRNPSYGTGGETFVFDLGEVKRGFYLSTDPRFESSVSARSFTHALRARLIESRTGRGDLLIHFERSKIGDCETAPFSLDISRVNIALRSTSPEFSHLLGRPVVGLPQLRVFQNVAPGACYQLTTDLSAHHQFDVPPDIIVLGD